MGDSEGLPELQEYAWRGIERDFQELLDETALKLFETPVDRRVILASALAGEPRPNLVLWLTIAMERILDGRQ